MRKITAIVLVLLLTASVASAEMNGYDALDATKYALVLMNYGEFEAAAAELGMSGKGDALQELADTSLPEVYTISVQTDVAVAYSYNDGWRIAVPVEEPYCDTVNCFVVQFTSDFTASACGVLTYGSVLEQTEDAQKVVWQDAYTKGKLVLVPDIG